MSPWKKGRLALILPLQSMRVGTPPLHFQESLTLPVIFCKRLVNPYTRSQHFPLEDVNRVAQISVPIRFAVPSMGYLEDINNPELNRLEAAYFLHRYLFERILILSRTPFQARAPRVQASQPTKNGKL
ncbi:hypothetical protein J6590_096865 [Homalodisca vitripennis]|nr:hypothetical protein J6590_096865 [Homalodisca vitripennis]